MTTAFNKAIKNRAFYALDWQQVARWCGGWQNSSALRLPKNLPHLGVMPQSRDAVGLKS